VNVIRVPDHASVATIPVGSDPHSVAFTPDGRFALVTNSLSDTVSKINTDSFLVVGTIPVPQVPQGIDVSGLGDFAYVAGSRLARVAKINLASNQVVANVAVPAAPVGLAVTPTANFQVAAQATPTRSRRGSSPTRSPTRTRARGRSNDATASIPANTFANAWGRHRQRRQRRSLGTWPAARAVRSRSRCSWPPLPPGLQLTTTAVLAGRRHFRAGDGDRNGQPTPQYSLGKVDAGIRSSPGAMSTITYANNAAANANGEGAS
jgi:YVTN family beta-propeller protein